MSKRLSGNIGDDKSMIRPCQWFDISPANREFRTSVKDLLSEKQSPYGHGWSLLRGYFPVKTAKRPDIRYTNCLHLVIVPDTTRIRFMKEYPNAEPAEFYQLLSKRLANPETAPNYLSSEITITPPLVHTRSVDHGLYVNFNGPHPQHMPGYSYSWRKELPKDHSDYAKGTRVPTVGILGGVVRYTDPPNLYSYGYFLPYANNDFELLDSVSVRVWLNGSRQYSQDVRCVRQPDSNILFTG